MLEIQIVVIVATLPNKGITRSISTYAALTTRYLIARNAQPVEGSRRTRTYSATSKDDKRGALYRERRPCVMAASRASICRYLFSFSIGKYRRDANPFSAIWLRRFCHVSRHVDILTRSLSSSSLLLQTTPFSLL